MTKRLYLFIIIIIINSLCFSQGEANIWYFGENAGLNFNNGNPVALTNGQLVTDEGCATISDSSGQLLFYTDGITVYNRNHVVMVNGNGLMGHPSSVQSATIIPKPGSPKIFYIFTTPEEGNPVGLRYSVVDMNLDNSYGAITSEKNVLIFSPICENLGITKHGNGVDYWIVTHGLNNNTFYSFKLTATGLDFTPVITDIGAVITGTPLDFFEAGSIKISPSGSKLAFTSVMDIAQLFDFNNFSGILSNPITLSTESGELIGAAFSPDESLLYISNSFGKIHQYNLNSINIPNSELTIYNGNIPGQLQVGPDNKIYIAFSNRFYLGVIHNPNVQGLGCNFQLDGVYLGGKKSRLGLPSFNQSFFFTPSISYSSNCVGEPAAFQFFTNQPVLSATWDFGDGVTVNGVNPTHVYMSPGTYNVIVNVVTPLGTGSNNINITVFPTPVLIQTVCQLKQCDDDNDGFSLFNLSEANQLVSSNLLGLNFTYFETLTDAENNINSIINTTAYQNQIVSNDQVFIRVQNASGCFQIATLNLFVSTTLIPSTFQRTFSVCDDTISGSTSDGISVFDFSSVTSDLQSLYPSGQAIMIRYYENISDALSEQNAINNPSAYVNYNSPFSQSIYVRVDSLLDNSCLGLGLHITLNVEAVPNVSPLQFQQCDDDQDGKISFDTSTIETNLLQGLTNVTLMYWDENNIPLPSPLPNPFLTSSQTIKVRVINNSSNSCYTETTISFIVNDLPQVFSIPFSITNVCDNELNPLDQDGLYLFDTSNFESFLVGNQSGMIVNYYDSTGNPLSSPLPNPFYSGTQNLIVEVVNPVNTSCKATGVIQLVVNPIPKIKLKADELVCSDNPLFTKTLTAGLIDDSTASSFTYQWYLNGSILSNATGYELIVNSEGVYTVEVSNSSGCKSERTITVVSSSIASINETVIVDFSDNNSITVIASGSGIYEYSLDGINFQSSPVFNSILPGVYVIYVKDLNGCGMITSTVNILGVPKYFTPNGDGFNEDWNIIGFSTNNSISAIVSIYDRFGRLLTSFNPKNQGWNGTINGSLLPSTDYWYVIQLSDGRNIKGHFCLKR
jgi:gliding motility-associated-like protein